MLMEQGTVSIATVLLPVRPRFVPVSEVEQFSESSSRVAFFREGLRKRCDVVKFRIVAKPTGWICRDSSRRWTEPGPDRSSRRVTDGGVAVRVGEENAARGESIDIRSFRVGMSAETTDIVVQVVDRDQKNIGPVRGKRET